MILQKFRLKNKTEKPNRGFTLPELLTATLIMAMVALVVGSGVTVAMRSYQTITKKSEADLLLSTELASMKQYLVYSSYDSGSGAYNEADGSTENGGSEADALHFTVSGMSGNFAFINENQGISLQHYAADGSGDQSLALVSDKTITQNMSVSLEGFSYSDADHIYTGTITVRDSSDQVISSEDFALCPLM